MTQMHEERPARTPRKRDPQRRGRRRWPFVAVLASVLVIALCAGLFCWQKWWRFDDAADIQGEWKVTATGDTIVFDARDLKLTKGISYEYRLDAGAKTISYSFGKMEGAGCYYFSADRRTLVIIEGDGRLGVLAELGILPAETIAGDTATDAVTVLAKVSDDPSAEPSGTGNGLSSGNATRGEREFAVKPDPPSSSTSGGSRSSAGSAAADASRGRSTGALPADTPDSPSEAPEYGEGEGGGSDSPGYDPDDAYGEGLYDGGYYDLPASGLSDGAGYGYDDAGYYGDDGGYDAGYDG